MIEEVRNTTVYNQDLIVKYNRYFSKSFILKNFIIVGLVSLGFAIYMLANAQYAYALLMLGVLVVYLILTVVLQKLTVSRMLKKSPLVANPVTQTYVFTKENIDVYNDKQSYHVKFDHVESVKEAPGFFLIKTMNKKTLIVDKEGFDSEKDYKDLRAYFIVRFNLKD